MFSIKELTKKLNFLKKCREHYNVGLWQCPGFLFIIMGIINISSMIGTYLIISRYNAPEVVIFSISGVSIIIFSIGVSIIHGVEQIACANKVKSEFVSIASHQLRTPLSGIRWSIDILLMDNKKKQILNNKQLEYLRDIQENVARMTRLVNDLLDVSRIESGKMAIDIKKVDLKKIVEDTVSEFDFFAKSKNSKIITEIDENISKVLTDPNKIKMVIQNLIDNAIKYIDSKNGVVKVCLKNQGDSVYCSVEDNGIGISKKEQKKLFDKFFRGAKGVKNQTIGSGLGLYIAKAIVENSNGKIGFVSKEKMGSKFWFTIPKADTS